MLLIAVAIERPLSFRDSPPEDHTHAFDVFCLPFPADTNDPVARSIALLADRVPAHAWSALGLLAGLAAAGAALAVFDPQKNLEARLAQAPAGGLAQFPAGGLAQSPAGGLAQFPAGGLAQSPAGGLAQSPAGGLARGRSFDIVVPAPVLGGVLLCGLIALSVVAAYLYYPGLPTCIEDLRFVEMETHSAALAGDRRRTEVWIAAWEDLVRRTEVGIWIRRGSVSREMTAAAEALRERIEALEHAVLDPEEIDREQVAAELKLVLAAGRAHRDALRPACAAGCPSGADQLQP